MNRESFLPLGCHNLDPDCAGTCSPIKAVFVSSQPWAQAPAELRVSAPVEPWVSALAEESRASMLLPAPGPVEPQAPALLPARADADAPPPVCCCRWRSSPSAETVPQ